jgi:exodeoxyribonuclease-5
MFEIQEAFADLRPTHAATAYKAQGSTYGTVFIDLHNIGKCNIPSTVARMLYVAITRASNQVVLFGELPAKYSG